MHEILNDDDELQESVYRWEARFEKSERRRMEATAQAAELLGQNHAAMHLIASELELDMIDFNSSTLLDLVNLLIRNERF